MVELYATLAPPRQAGFSTFRSRSGVGGACAHEPGGARRAGGSKNWASPSVSAAGSFGHAPIARRCISGSASSCTAHSQPADVARKHAAEAMRNARRSPRALPPASPNRCGARKARRGRRRPPRRALSASRRAANRPECLSRAARGGLERSRPRRRPVTRQSCGARRRLRTNGEVAYGLHVGSSPERRVQVVRRHARSGNLQADTS